MSSADATPLRELEVLAVDCQATAAAPSGHLLELGWARVTPATTLTHSCLISLPDGVRVPPAVARITGISERMRGDAVPPAEAWQTLITTGACAEPVLPTVIHFARFERPFLRSLAGDPFPLDITCTHEIALRLLPDLPRRSLRAIAGYFGYGVGPLRRSADHVRATAFVWHHFIPLLAAEGASTWGELREWLATPSAVRRQRRRVWPLARDARLSLPDAPGVYRLLRTSGDVLYVGKATSLHDRVNSYFRHQHGIPERMLEMLSQVRDVSYEVTATPLEAALLEPDEIKRHAPPYNIALTSDRRVWFSTAEMSTRRSEPSRDHVFGPIVSSELLAQFTALANADPTSLGTGRWGPERDVFETGYAAFRAAHPEFSREQLSEAARLLGIGTRLWREGRRDGDGDEPDGLENEAAPATWTPESVQLGLEWLALRAAHARRRAMWLTRLAEASVVWTEPGTTRARLIVIEGGNIVQAEDAVPDTVPPIPPGHTRTREQRLQNFTIGHFDRLRVLSTELKRLCATGGRVAVRFGPAPPLTTERLTRALMWI